MNKRLKKTMIMVMAIAILAVGATSFAGWGRGSGWHMGGGPMYWGTGPGYGPGRYTGEINEDQAKKIDAANKAFFNETRELRDEIYAKRLALRSELAKKDTDEAAVLKLQKEISELAGKLGEKRALYLLELKKAVPSAAGYGFGGGPGMGYGPRFGGSMPGYCWR